jgi:hypothetical protein
LEGFRITVVETTGNCDLSSLLVLEPRAIEMPSASRGLQQEEEDGGGEEEG